MTYHGQNVMLTLWFLSIRATLYNYDCFFFVCVCVYCCDFDGRVLIPCWLHYAITLIYKISSSNWLENRRRKKQSKFNLIDTQLHATPARRCFQLHFVILRV